MKTMRIFIGFSLLLSLLGSCGKTNPADPKKEAEKQLLATHVPNIQGSRTWTHQFHSSDNSQTYVFDTVYADTTFSLTVLNDTTIAVYESRPLTLNRENLWVGTGDSAYLNTVIHFSRYPEFHNYETVSYYYNEDLLVVFKVGGSMGGSWYSKFTSKN